jgi:hypothetical protein
MRTVAEQKYRAQARAAKNFARRKGAGSGGYYVAPVRCMTTGEIFESAVEAGKKYGATNIQAAIQGRYEYAGRLPSGEKLYWEWA